MNRLPIPFILFVLAGCSTIRAPSYSPDASNLSIIRTATNKLSVAAREPRFEDIGSIMCRAAGRIQPPDKATFTNYIKGALEDELGAAGLLAESGTLIVMQLTKLDFSTTLGSTKWFIDATYSVAGKTAEISTIYYNRSSFAGGVACNNMAVYLPKAVAAHLGQLFHSVAFVDAIGLRQASQEVESSLAERLRQLEDARNKDLITEQEYRSKREAIIGGF